MIALLSTLVLQTPAVMQALDGCEVQIEATSAKAECDQMKLEAQILSRKETDEAIEARLKAFEVAHPDVRKKRAQINIGHVKASTVFATEGTPPVLFQVTVVRSIMFRTRFVTCEDRTGGNEQKCFMAAMALSSRMKDPQPSEEERVRLREREETVYREGGTIDYDEDGTPELVVTFDSERHRHTQRFEAGQLRLNIEYDAKGHHLLTEMFDSSGKITERQRAEPFAHGERRITEKDTNRDGAFDERLTTTYDSREPRARRRHQVKETRDPKGGETATWQVVSDHYDTGIVF